MLGPSLCPCSSRIFSSQGEWPLALFAHVRTCSHFHSKLGYHGPRPSSAFRKAYAKLHGTYDAIEGGWVNDGLVDMTGEVWLLMAVIMQQKKMRHDKEHELADAESIYAVNEAR